MAELHTYKAHCTGHSNHFFFFSEENTAKNNRGGAGRHRETNNGDQSKGVMLQKDNDRSSNHLQQTRTD